MLEWWLTIAGATPPALPEWRPEVSDNDSEAQDDAPWDTEAAGEVRVDDAEAVVCGGEPAERPDWLAVERPTLVVSGLVVEGRERWVLATARRGDEVVHWRQGPFTPEAESVVVELALDALAPFAAGERKGQVFVKVVETDEAGHVVAASAMPELWFVGSAFGRVAELPVARVVSGNETFANADL